MLRALQYGFVRNGRGTTGASLVLDFLSGINDSRITYSGGANGTRVNSAGLIVAATTPRFDYDPVTLAAKGLLVEEQRTNHLLRSSELDNAAWTKTNASVTADASAGPRGPSTMDKLVEDATAGVQHLIVQSVTKAAASEAWVGVFFVKAGERTRGQCSVFSEANGVFLDFDASAGTIQTPTAYGTGFTAGTATVESWGGGVYRIIVPVTTNAGVTLGLQVNLANAAGSIGYNGDGVSGFYLDAMDLQQGSFATSYIPTVASAVTRTADSAVMTGTDFSSWFNASEGTFVVEADSKGAAVTSVAASASDNTSNNYIALMRVAGTTDARAQVVTSGSGVATFDEVGAFPGADTITRWAIAYKENDFAAAFNGGAAQTDVSGAVPTVSQLDIGALPTGDRRWNGHIRSLKFWPRRLPNTQLVGLTA